MQRPSSSSLLKFLKLASCLSSDSQKFSRNFVVRVFVTSFHAREIYVVHVFCLYCEEKNQNRIRTDIEFEVFQGALSHANAQHSCKLMRQASCDKIRRKPFAWCKEYPFEVRTAKGIEFEVLIFLRTFWIKPKSGRIKKKRRKFCLF